MGCGGTGGGILLTDQSSWKRVVVDSGWKVMDGR